VYIDKLPEAISKVRPDFPEAARRSGVEGVVIIKALIGVDGLVKDAMIVQSVPLLDEAAMASVRQWTFKPALRGGVPVAVWVAVPVKFSVY